MSPEDPAADPAPEHPFTRALRTWEAWSSANTWQWVVAEARRHGRDLGAVGNLDELTTGPEPLEALRANREVIELMTLWQWQAMRAAREQGHDWHKIGKAVGLDSEEARRAYLAAVKRQELAAQAMPELGRLLRYDPRWRDLADDSDAHRSR